MQEAVLPISPIPPFRPHQNHLLYFPGALGYSALHSAYVASLLGQKFTVRIERQPNPVGNQDQLNALQEADSRMRRGIGHPRLQKSG